MCRNYRLSSVTAQRNQAGSATRVVWIRRIRAYRDPDRTPLGLSGLCEFAQAEHQALARQLGAVWVGGATEMPPDKLHGSIIFAPAGELVPPALRALDRGGTLALAGIHMSPIPSLDYDRDVFGERVIRSVTANTRQDGLDLLREAAAIPIKPHTIRFPLEHANRALQELKAGTFQGAAVLTM